MRRMAAAALLAAMSACGSGTPSPARLETGSVACANCRMIVSNARFAAQIVAPGEEPQFFDDLMCLANHLRRAAPKAGAVAYVADHLTGEWVAARRAAFTRAPEVSTPMGGGIIAHSGATARDRDPASRGGTNVPASEIVGDTGGAAR
jgi:copper chaperone NosL